MDKVCIALCSEFWVYEEEKKTQKDSSYTHIIIWTKLRGKKTAFQKRIVLQL